MRTTPAVTHLLYSCRRETNLKLYIPILEVQSPLGRKVLCFNENTNDPSQLCTKRPQHGTSTQLSAYIRA